MLMLQSPFGDRRSAAPFPFCLRLTGLHSEAPSNLRVGSVLLFLRTRLSHRDTRVEPPVRFMERCVLCFEIRKGQLQFTQLSAQGTGRFRTFALCTHCDHQRSDANGHLEAVHKYVDNVRSEH
jgi:hypothetical protein